MIHSMATWVAFTSIYDNVWLKCLIAMGEASTGIYGVR